MSLVKEDNVHIENATVLIHCDLYALFFINASSSDHCPDVIVCLFRKLHINILNITDASVIYYLVHNSTHNGDFVESAGGCAL